MAGSLPPSHAAYSIGPRNISHSNNGPYNDNSPSNTSGAYSNEMTFQAMNRVPGLNQMIGVFGGPQQPMHGHGLSPSHTISPTIYSPATPTYIQSPSLSTPHKSQYTPNSPSVADNVPLFSSLTAGHRLDATGWNQQTSPRTQLSDLQYPNLTMGSYQQMPANSAPSHSMPASNPAEVGSSAWLSTRISNLSPHQRIEVESAYELWRFDSVRRILVVNMYCDWFESNRRPKKEELLQFYRPQIVPAEETSRTRGGKSGQGARGGALGYTCEWPGCGQSLQSRTDRAHEHALNHLHIKLFVCDAKKCKSSFLRKNELNRHLRSCKIRPANATITQTNALFLSMPSSPIASTSRQVVSQSASNRETSRRTRSFRGVSSDNSPPPTSGHGSSSAPQMTNSFPAFLPQATPQRHFPPQHEHQLQASGFGGAGDGQMAYHGQLTQQHTLHQPHAHQNQRPNSQHMGVNTDNMSPISAYAEQFSSPPRVLGPGGSPPMHASPRMHPSPQMRPLYDLHRHPLQRSNLSEGLVVPSHSPASLSTPLDDLALSSRTFPVSPTQSFVYGPPAFYHTGIYPNNGNVPSYVYYPQNQQQPPQQQ